MAYLQKQFPDQAQRELDMAMDLIKRIIQEKGPLDPTLQTKVENATSKAGIMMRQKGRSADVNSPNVP